MTDDYEALRAAAEAVLKHRQDGKPQKSVSGDERDAVVGFVSLNSPETILALLSDLDTTRTALLRAEGERDEARAELANVQPILSAACDLVISHMFEEYASGTEFYADAYNDWNDDRNTVVAKTFEVFREPLCKRWDAIMSEAQRIADEYDTTPDPSKEA